jgi:hypothetical protein
MKRPSSGRTFGMFATLVLLALGVAVAQLDMGNKPAPGATFTSGTVTSRTHDSFTIERESGEFVTLLLTDATVGANRLQVGERARIDYHVNERGQAVADTIQAYLWAGDEAAVDTGQPVTSERRPAAAEAVRPSSAATAVLPAVSELPATASRLPTLALLGLLALAAATVLRVAR